MEINFLVRVSARKDFFCRVKIFYRSSQIFFSTTKLPKVTRLAFDCAQVLGWVYATIAIVIWVYFFISEQF